MTTYTNYAKKYYEKNKKRLNKKRADNMKKAAEREDAERLESVTIVVVGKDAFELDKDGTISL